jgi:hypothetical protein
MMSTAINELPDHQGQQHERERMMQTYHPSVDIVIAYYRTDSDFVDRLESDLKAHNLTVWVDRRKLEGAEVWDAETRTTIDQSRIFLMVISPDALASPWVTKEYQYALKRHKEVIPVRYYPTAEIPPELQRLQWVDFLLTMNFESTYPAHLQDLLKAIDFHLQHYRFHDAARLSRQTKRDKRIGFSLASGIVVYTLLIVLLTGAIAHTYFAKQMVITVPMLQYVPVLSVPPTSIVLSANRTSARYGAAVTLTATADTPVGGTGYVIDIWDTFDNVQLTGASGHCTSSARCNVDFTLPGATFNMAITYQAYIEKMGGGLSTMVAFSNIVWVVWHP